MKRVLTFPSSFFCRGFNDCTNKPDNNCTQSQATTLHPRLKRFVKPGIFPRTENFGDIHKPTDQQKYDLLNLQESGRYRLTIEGVSEAGSWTLSKTILWITLTNRRRSN